MIKLKSDKLFKYSLTIVLVSVILISLVVGLLEKPRIEQYKVFKIYTISKDNMLSDSVDKSMLKQFNEINSEYEKQFNGNLKISISPQEGIYSYYRIKVVSNRALNDKELDDIFKNYTDFIKHKNIKGIEHISAIPYVNAINNNIKMEHIIICLLQGVIFSAAFFILFRLIYEKLSKNNLIIFSACSILLFSVGIILKGIVALTAIYLTIWYIIKIINRNKDSRKELVIVTLIALVMRCLVTVAMMAFNYYKYKTLYSYVQTDEIFYYSTGDYIGQVLSSFRFPNLRAITKLDQYGYNFFVGVMKLFNNGDVFYTAKIVNILASVIFVAIFFEFVYKVTQKKNITIISALLMAVMPTFAVFSSFALRDIFISICMFVILSEVIFIRDSDKKYKSIVKIIVFSIFLWYLRRYALLLTAAFSALYIILKFCVDRKVNIVLVIVSLGFVLSGLIVFASKLYSFNLFNMIKSYIIGTGIMKFISGLILSLVNLDFMINTGATLYTSTKALVLRSLYPETLFLIITFPIMCLGIVKAFKRNASLVIVLILMFVGFISVYKIQYGGWFLRTQLQIFPYQYMLIAWGIGEVIDNLSNTPKWLSILK